MNHYWKMVNLLCCFAFSWQMYGIMDEWINPKREIISISDKKLKGNFPFIIKICPDPGFNLTAIREAGYFEIEPYFRGENMFDTSVIGWAGYTNTSETTGTVDWVYKKAQNFRTLDNFIKG